MCKPGVNPERTDEQLASLARNHLRMLLLCVEDLRGRGYSVGFRSQQDCLMAPPKSVEFTKKVSL